MLINLKTLIEDPFISFLFGSSKIEHLQKGVYQTASLNFSHSFSHLHKCVRQKEIDTISSFASDYPENIGINSYGVCDNYKQILDQSTIESNPDRYFVISITPILKSEQPEQDGWRWEKWGPYIGECESEHDYLHDEPNIEKVFVYHVHELDKELLRIDDAIDSEIAAGLREGLIEITNICDNDGHVVTRIISPIVPPNALLGKINEN